MRRFTLGSGNDLKIVVIEVNGARMSVVRTMPDASKTRSQKDFASEAEARSASDHLARELMSRGYAESVARRPVPADAAGAALKSGAKGREHDRVGPNRVFEDVEAPAAIETPLPPRRGSEQGLRSADQDAPPKKKKAGSKKKKKKAQRADALDKRVLAGVGVVGVALLGVVAFLVYDFFIKPPTIVGVWRGGMVEHEISRSLKLTQYDLVLDDKRRAALGIERAGLESTTLVGTYAVIGNRLKLTGSDDDGDPSVREYKFVLGRSTLELFDPGSGTLLVQLIRFRETPVVRAQAPPKSKRAEPTPGDAETVDGSEE
jgi:hypothetical protein